MKSPVAAIRGAAELLQDPMPAEQRAKFLGNIQAEARRLQKLIDRLLALSAIESRKALVQPEPVALVDLAETVRAQLQPAADARGITIALTSTGHPTVRGESFLLEIALTNLVQNGLDFSPPGGRVGITIACADDAPEVAITVEDDGPGIPDYALPRVFERFYSLRHPATGRKSSGLGLCFVREAAALHGGTITLGNRTDRAGAAPSSSFPLARTSRSSLMPLAGTQPLCGSLRQQVPPGGVRRRHVPRKTRNRAASTQTPRGKMPGQAPRPMRRHGTMTSISG